mmetsp:Transcript_20467/g.40950  ORF Transcript_20467/g.40950 Transcript_20467/m.40950 type:complete len:499 (+) Transcript_20467:130-1626(+)
MHPLKIQDAYAMMARPRWTAGLIILCCCVSGASGFASLTPPRRGRSVALAATKPEGRKDGTGPPPPPADPVLRAAVRSARTTLGSTYADDDATGPPPPPDTPPPDTPHPLSFLSPAGVRALEANPFFEVGTLGLVVVSSLLVSLTTLPAIQDGPLNAVLSRGEDLITAFFAAEYVARWYSAEEGPFSWRYVVRPLALVDLVAILPALLRTVGPGFGSVAQIVLMSYGVPTSFFSNLFPAVAGDGLVSLRLLRLLRFQEVLSDLETFRQFESALFGINPKDVKSWQLQFARVLISIFTLLFVSSGLIYSAEHTVNPQIPDFFTALYFGLTTLTTVGFGDIVPITSTGRFVVGATILAGVAIVPIQAANLVEALLDFEQETKEEKGRRDKLDALREEYNQDPDYYVMDEARTVMRTGAVRTLALLDFEQQTKEKRINREQPDDVAGGRKYNTDPEYYAAEEKRTVLRTGAVRTCPTCEAGPHRRDAFFCWSCGCNLPDWD